MSNIGYIIVNYEKYCCKFIYLTKNWGIIKKLQNSEPFPCKLKQQQQQQQQSN